jgi:hypothetical protein
MRNTLQWELERIVRQPETTNHNAIILEVGLDTVLVKTPPGASRVKRTVKLAEHIKAKHHLLKPGIPCQIEKQQDGLYVIAIFEEGIELPGPYSAVQDDDTNPGNNGQDTLLQTPRPQARIDCEQESWVITWEAIPNAASYEVFATADETIAVSAAGEPIAPTTETEALVAFNLEADPLVRFFAVRAIAENGTAGPYSPWVTDEFSLQQPVGFTACPVPGGYKLNVDLARDTTHSSPAFSHWEVEWADDEAGLNAEVVIPQLLPEELPRFISAQAPGNWTFDSSADETWGHTQAASPDDWESSGHMASGSRIIYDGSAVSSEDVSGANQWFGGQILQAMDQFTGQATDSLTFWLKLVRSSGSGSFPARVRLGSGYYDTTHVDLTTGGSIDEYQAMNHEQPPYEYTEFTATGDWQELALTLSEEAVGQTVGFLMIKVDCQGVPLDQILIDDIHFGPGGLQPATQKWFRLRAITCAGLASEWTDWVSGWADLIIFAEPDNHGAVNCLTPANATG